MIRAMLIKSPKLMISRMLTKPMLHSVASSSNQEKSTLKLTRSICTMFVTTTSKDGYITRRDLFMNHQSLALMMKLLFKFKDFLTKWTDQIKLLCHKLP